MAEPPHDLARRLADRSEAVCRHYLSNGRRQGNYWTVGDVRNTPDRSMFVRLKDTTKGSAGRWTDAATGEHGDLLDVVREALGLIAFGDVAKEARAFLGVSHLEPRSPAPVHHSTRAPSGSIEAGRRLFGMSQPINGTVVETYLGGRGITTLHGTGALRFHPCCYYRPDDAGPTETWPALIAADRSPHQPTPAELKEQARYAGWGMAREPWPKYDHFPSERLSIVIQANAYSGLRRTFSDRQSKSLEPMLPRILEAFAEHAAFAKNRRHEQEVSARRRQDAERLRRLDEAFGAREKRRIEFIDAVHEQHIERKKLEDVLAHLDSSTDPEHPSIEMIAWLRRRIRQLDALISPVFLELSARSAKVTFVEPQATTDDERYAYYPHLASILVDGRRCRTGARTKCA